MEITINVTKIKDFFKEVIMNNFMSTNVKI